MLIQEKQAIFPIYNAGESASGNKEMNSVDMSNYDHAAFFLHFGSTALATGTSLVVTIESATSDSGDTADVTFHYSVNTASSATLSSVMTYAADATASTLSFATANDIAGHCLILQVDGDELRSTSLGKVYNWLTVDIDNATAGVMDAWAILSEPRYAGASMPIAV